MGSVSIRDLRKSFGAITDGTLLKVGADAPRIHLFDGENGRRIIS